MFLGCKSLRVWRAVFCEVMT